MWTGRWRFVWPHVLVRGAVGVKLAFGRVVDSCTFAVAAHSTPKGGVHMVAASLLVVLLLGLASNPEA